jgi:hypothetical protein
MIGDLISKQLIVVKADTSQAKAEIRGLSAVEQKAARDRVEAQEKHNAMLERGAQRFALYAAGAAAGWSIISSSVKKYENHLVSLGSKGEAELTKLRDVTGGLSKAQDNLQIAIAKVALEAAPAAKSLGDMANELANIVGGIGMVIAKAKEMPLPGGGTVGRAVGAAWDAGSWWNENWSPWGMSHQGGKAAYRWMGGGGTDNPRRDAEAEARVLSRYADTSTPGAAYTTPEQMQDGMFYMETALARADSALRRGNRAGKKAYKKQFGPKGGGGPKVDPYAGVFESLDLGATGGYSSGRYSQEDLDLLGLGAEPVAPAMGWEGVKVPESILNDLSALQDEIVSKQQQSVLEGIFGPVEEFDLYTTAWQGLESVVSAGFSAWIDGSKSVGTAMKEALHGFAKNLAGEALLQALRHGAYALGSLAFGDMKGAAAHGISAAKWGAVAVAAGVVGKVTAPSVGGGSANANAAAGIGGGGPRPSSGTGGTHNTIIIGDPLGYESPRSQAQRVRRGLDLADERTRGTRSVVYS